MRNVENQNTLPPNVNGKCYGFLEITIETIALLTVKHSKIQKICFMFWGENKSVVLNYNVNGIKNRYQIKTNCALFQSYLRHCENISVQLFGIQLIGNCHIRIPDRLYKSIDTITTTKVTSQIVTPRNFDKIGELTISIEMNFSKSAELQKHETFATFGNIEKKSSSAHCDKENLQVFGITKNISSKVSIKKPSISSRLSINNSRNKKIPDSNSLLKITIKELELNKFGLTAFQDFIINSNSKCILKCSAVSKLKAINEDNSNIVSCVLEKAISSKYFN